MSYIPFEFIQRIVLLKKTVIDMFRLFFMPGSLLVRPIKDVNQPEFYKIVTGPGLPLVVSFSGLGDNFSFSKTLSKFDINIIFVRDLSHQWFLGKLGKFGCGVNDICSGLKGEMDKIRPSKVIMIGSSAGGFAAILYGHLLNVNQVIAFSPQTFKSKFLSLRHWDYRTLDRVVEIYQNNCLEKKFLDLKNVIKEHSVSTDIIFGQNHRLDRIHAMRLRNGHIRHIGISSSSHNVAAELRQKNLLTSLILKHIGSENLKPE